MLDIKFIRENLQTVKTGLGRRNGNNHDLDYKPDDSKRVILGEG